jgi:hypothetical protein
MSTITTVDLAFAVYQCKLCDMQFEELGHPLLSYGHLTARSNATGELAYLDALHEPSVSEIVSLCESTTLYHMLKTYEQPRVVAATFLRLADVPPDGSWYSDTRRPNCPRCGSFDVSLNGVTNRIAEARVLQVTYNTWSTLSAHDKEIAVRQTIAAVVAEQARTTK